MNLHLKIWRQKNRDSAGSLTSYEARNIPEDCSFLEMLDLVNEDLLAKGQEPITFDHDCREGICGMCSLTINGVPHGPSETTTCQLYMRKFKDGETIYIEPFRAGAFPVLRDLTVDRSAFDRIQQAGGFITAHVGAAQDGNCILVPKPEADRAREAAACIGCGACVAQPERDRRALAMVRKMDEEGFGNCSNYLECEAVCPAEIPATVIGHLNRDYASASVKENL